jgi:hypothetical protein
MRAPVTAAEFFGPSHEQWAAAFDAVHQFAKRDGCPLGVDVIEHFRKRRDEWAAAQAAGRSSGRT